jgi:uroporphyrinogen decarboxylase
MDKLIQNFFQASCHQEVSKVPLALIADSPWIPGFAGIDTLDYYLDQKKWFEINITF